MKNDDQNWKGVFYSQIVGQSQLKLALELSFIEPRISGVLISGERGTGKSTAVRAFSRMMTGRLPVTLPINATEDRVVGGWDIGDLLKSKPTWKVGLLEEANGGLLYVDEVNLLDDHIVNIILDVTASELLTVERDSNIHRKEVRFTLIGTMNPEEGTLRPQLLDRFGLMVDVRGLTDANERRRVLQTVLAGGEPTVRKQAFQDDAALKGKLVEAKRAAQKIDFGNAVEKCVALAKAFGADGHRGDYTLALAARALVSLNGAREITTEHIAQVAPFALQHRRRVAGQRELAPWTATEDDLVKKTLGHAGS
jgi:magnesium chelatase subunit I